MNPGDRSLPAPDEPRPDGPPPTAATDLSRLEQALPRLAALLRSSRDGSRGELTVERQFEAGQSNPTYLLRDGERRIVLRKQPFGDLLPKAHDVLREFAIMKALHDAGFPVPRPILPAPSRDTIGTDFFLMDFVPGIVEADPALAHRPAGERRAIYNDMAATLAELHAVDPAVLVAAGIAPRPGFVSRQVAIWSRQYAASQTEPDERIAAVAAWLAANEPPEGQPRIVHGDFRLENLILQGDRVGAVLDWELCAIGEPLCDLSYSCLWYDLPRDVLGGLSDLKLAGTGIPEKGAFIDLYSRLSGIDGHRSNNFFMAFSFYRLAAILQGVYRRALDGNAASPFAVERGGFARVCLSRAEHFAARG